MDSSKPQTGEDSKKFLKNIGNKLADEEEGNIKGGDISIEGFTKVNEQVK
jgi:hypothetical protein